MTRPDTRNSTSATQRSRAADVFVLSAMALVAIAFAAALIERGGAAIWAASALGLAMFAGFVAVHALVSATKSTGRKRRPAPEVRPGLDRHEVSVAAAGGGLERVAQASVQEVETPAGLVRLPDPSLGEAEGPIVREDGALSADALSVDALSAYVPPSAPTADSNQAGSYSRTPPFELPVLPSPVQDTMQAYWSYAPGAPRLDVPDLPPSGHPLSELPPPEQARADHAARELSDRQQDSFDPMLGVLPPLAERTAGAHHQPQASSPRQEDVDVIQSLIRKLADEVNAAEQGQAFARAAPDAPPPLPPGASATTSPHDTQLEASLSALRTTASTMRAQSAPRLSADDAALEAARAASHFGAAPASVPPPIPSAEPRRARAAEFSHAIAAGRIDVLLEPILALGDQRAQHYEVLLRLRNADGEALDPAADRAELKGTRILPLIDAAKISRTANLAARLGERGKPGSVFSSYSGESLQDRDFLAEAGAAVRARPNSAGTLVLTFSQDDVRGFEQPEWAALAELKALGFRFALAGVTDLDMSFEALAAAGFAFVKLRANVFLEGLRAPAGLIPASDICRYLAGAGLGLVVEGIDSEHTLALVFGFGVLLGQGQLFGQPRPVKADLVAGAREAAA